MKIYTGLDILFIPDFKISLKNGGEYFLKKVFSDEEQKIKGVEHLAGIFSAKEAVIKALQLKIDSWLQIRVCHQKNGKPFVVLSHKITKEFRSFDLSISHNKNYVVAIFVAIS